MPLEILFKIDIQHIELINIKSPSILAVELWKIVT